MSETVVSAVTHTPEYLLHKYWARKPHNVIRNVIESLTEEGDLVVDPCCGSGVTLREAELVNRRAVGFDVNPVACLISEVLINPPDVKTFIEAVAPVLKEADEICSETYSDSGRLIRYCRHELVVRCPSCGETVMPSELLPQKGKRCPHCGSTLRFNLENTTGTRVTGVVFDNGESIEEAPDVLRRQQKRSECSPCSVDVSRYNYPFAENRRILAYSGMSTSALFTKRNFGVLCHLEQTIDDIEDTRSRNAARLMVSASIAQCSRLIAFRNNLTSGGPAWSVPGFWVPAVHLETNPSLHLQARYKKFIKGLAALQESNAPGTAEARCIDAASGLAELADGSITAQLVFFDPPYGDSVPYLEFSAMWNSFLQSEPKLEQDISVSDRMKKDESWELYSAGLSSIVGGITRVLAENGWLVITFNNNDSRAWKALLTSLQSNGLICKRVVYQIPAVISSKAQMSVGGSYISDLYSYFQKGHPCQITDDKSPVIAYLKKCADFRGGRISRGMGMRLAMEAWLQNNIAVEHIDDIDQLLLSLFVPEGDWLLLRDAPSSGFSGSGFYRAVRTIAGSFLADGKKGWLELYEAVANEVSENGVPEMFEVREALEDMVDFVGKSCSLKPLTLF